MTLYFESHVTVEPVFDDRLAEFKRVASRHQFRAAELLMKKRREDSAERSKYDTFATGRSSDREKLQSLMLSLIRELQSLGFQVWRYKIEDCLLDSRYDDSLFPLNVKDEDGVIQSNSAVQKQEEAREQLPGLPRR